MKRAGIAAVGVLMVTALLTGAGNQVDEAAFLDGLTACENAPAQHSYGTAVASGGVALHSYGTAAASSVC